MDFGQDTHAEPMGEGLEGLHGSDAETCTPTPALPHRGGGCLGGMPHREGGSLGGLPHRGGKDLPPSLDGRGWGGGCLEGTLHRGDAFTPTPALPHQGRGCLGGMPHRGGGGCGGAFPHRGGKDLPPSLDGRGWGDGDAKDSPSRGRFHPHPYPPPSRGRGLRWGPPPSRGGCRGESRHPGGGGRNSAKCQLRGFASLLPQPASAGLKNLHAAAQRRFLQPLIQHRQRSPLAHRQFKVGGVIGGERLFARKS